MPGGHQPPAGYRLATGHGTELCCSSPPARRRGRRSADHRGAAGQPAPAGGSRAAQADSWPQRAGTFTATAAIARWRRADAHRLAAHARRHPPGAPAGRRRQWPPWGGRRRDHGPPAADAARRPTRTGSAIPADPEGPALYPELLHANARQWPQRPPPAHGCWHGRRLGWRTGIWPRPMRCGGIARRTPAWRRRCWHHRGRGGSSAPVPGLVGEPARAAQIYGQLAARYPQQPAVLARAQALQAADSHGRRPRCCRHRPAPATGRQLGKHCCWPIA